MTLTDQEKSQIREAASVPLNQFANPDTCRALLSLLDELDSTRQQLTALRDELLADSEKSVASSGEGSSPTMTESFHRGRSTTLYWVLGKLAEILKGTP